MNLQENKQTPSNILQHCYKWIVLISFSLNSFCNLFLCDAISPIWSFVSVYYNTNDYDLNWYANCYYIAPMTFAFLINPLILKNFGFSQILSCSLTALGLWLLVLVKQNFYLGLVGFILLGSGEASYYQVPLRIKYSYLDLSKIWFEPKERIFSTFLAQYITTSASLLGYAISTFYFDGVVDQEEFNQKYQYLVIINAIVATIILGINFTTLKEPENEKISIQMRESIWNSTYKMLTTPESIYDLLSVSSFIGMSWCYPLLFSTQQYSIGQTYMDVNKVNMAFYAGQIISATICTLQLQKQSDKGLQLEYDKYIKYITGIGFLFLVIEILFFDMITGNWLAIINLFIGAGMGGIQSILLESLMEKHFPVQELVIGTMLTAVASAEYLIITMILSRPQYSSYGFQISCFLIIPSFCYILVFYETQFKRFECEA